MEMNSTHCESRQWMAVRGDFYNHSFTPATPAWETDWTGWRRDFFIILDL
jgi:hypothetical protein